MSEINLAKFSNEVLHYHNLERVKYGGVPPLTLDTNLSALSQNYANKLAFYNTGLEHNTERHNTGENLYSMTNAKPTGRNVVNSWVNYEVGMYDFNQGDFSHQTGHFTQAVWKNTKKVGVGMARGGDTWYVVCNYWPAGNVIGRFKENVLPPKQKPKRNHNHNLNKLINHKIIIPNDINVNLEKTPLNSFEKVASKNYEVINNNNNNFEKAHANTNPANKTNFQKIANRNNIKNNFKQVITNDLQDLYNEDIAKKYNHNNDLTTQKDHKKMYTIHSGESLYSMFERYLRDKNNRYKWRELLKDNNNNTYKDSNYY